MISFIVAKAALEQTDRNEAIKTAAIWPSNQHQQASVLSKDTKTEMDRAGYQGNSKSKWSLQSDVNMISLYSKKNTDVKSFCFWQFLSNRLTEKFSLCLRIPSKVFKGIYFTSKPRTAGFALRLTGTISSPLLGSFLPTAANVGKNCLIAFGRSGLNEGQQ